MFFISKGKTMSRLFLNVSFFHVFVTGHQQQIDLPAFAGNALRMAMIEFLFANSKFFAYFFNRILIKLNLACNFTISSSSPP